MAFEYGIATIIIVLLVVIFLWKGIKKVAAWVLLIILALALFGTIFSLDVFKDVTDLAQNLPTARKLFVLKDDSTLHTAFESSALNANALSFIDQKTIASFQSSYAKGDLNTIRGSYYKLVIVDAAALTSNKLTVNNNEIAVADVLEAIRADNTRERVVQFIIKEKSLPDTAETKRYVQEQLGSSIKTDADMRATLFVQLIADAVARNPLFVTRGLASNTIIVYPETITFKVLKILPESIAQKLVQSFT